MHCNNFLALTILLFFTHQKVLRYHHTILKDRKINVEVTAGGGGNSETRKNKIKLENDKVREKLRKTQNETIERNANASQ